MLKFHRVTGEDLDQYLPQVAELRIKVFHEFPYLYDGDLAYEKKYLKTYAEAPDSIVIAVSDNQQIIGAATAVPLQYETEEVQIPFRTAGISPEKVFYCGESVLLPEYRGKGIGVEFFKYREAHAVALGRYEKVCFCAVQRPADHPNRPKNYQPLDEFWRHRGYEIQPHLKTSFFWKELGEKEESPKPMTFWMKSLNRLGSNKT
ncbi:MAG: GNAT family N-acetyltransferase [Pseudomonadales bacterium]|nr:GNAT family N-acetyltransferase [Pseudomonadales bacterium]